MISNKFRILVLACCALPSLAWAVQLQFPAAKDNTLYENQAGDFSNGAGPHLYAGMTGSMSSEELRRAVVEFELSGIPPGSIVNSASVSVTINLTAGSPVADVAGLHRVLAEWGEGDSNAGSPGGSGEPSAVGDATWIHRFHDVQFWTVPGGDFEATASATDSFGITAPETLVFSSAGIVDDVQGWVDSSSDNHGWILIADENTPQNARRFYSRESIGTHPALIPLLTVDVTLPPVTANLVLIEVADGLEEPVGIANANDGSGRLFIIERGGLIRIFDTETQTLLATPYLDIQALVDDAGGEQGLLGLAFHPDFSGNRQFYVYYIRDPGPGLDRSVVARFTQSEGNPNVANASGTTLMEFEQEASNHNGGDLHFGADGYLYIASGDGGGSNDEYGNAQNVNSLKGKMLRIDVDGTPPGGAELCGLTPAYGIPPGNAFPGNGNGCDEILHIGLRNPWRFSFDAQTEELFIGDVGQGSWEEVDLAAPGASGLNFGWSCREGDHAFLSGNPCLPGPLTAPILEYSSVGECAVTGGYVYRGGSTALFGRYVFGDYCSGRIWVATRDGSLWNREEWTAAAPVLRNITAFGQDEHCELYVADVDRLADPGDATAKIYRIDDTEFIGRSSFEARRCQ